MQDDPRLIKGRHTYGNPRIYGDKSVIKTGNFCSISDFAVFDAGFNHNPSYISQFPFSQKLPGLEHLADRHPFSYGDTVIGNDVWIGDQAFIRSGVTIGDGAIIGYGAIITKDVRPYGIMVGNPAIETRRRFPDWAVEVLLKIKWWKWPDEKIREYAHILMSGDVGIFIGMKK